MEIVLDLELRRHISIGVPGTYIGYPNRVTVLGFRQKVNAMHTKNILENCIAFYFSFLK